MTLLRFWEEFFDHLSLVLVLSICSLAFFFNGLVMMLILGNVNLRRPQNIFVLNLALADIGTCVVAIWDIFLAHQSLRILKMEPVLNSMLLVSVMSIFAIAVDRYVALKGAPLTHHTMFTTPRVLLACALLWIFTFLICSIEFIIPASHRTISYFFSPVIVISTLILTAITYMVIFNSMKNPVLGSNNNRNYNDVRRRRTKKVLTTFTIILVTNFICWLPMCVFLFLEYGSDPEDLSTNFWIASSFSFDLTALNAAINPLCFLWRLPEAKLLLDNPGYELKKLLCCLWHPNRNHTGNNGNNIAVFRHSTSIDENNGPPRNHSCSVSAGRHAIAQTNL